MPTPTALPPAATPVVLPTPSPAILQAIDRGKTFLQAQYDPAVGLLEESPILGAGNFYLTEDNALAAHALRMLGMAELAGAIQEKFREYGHTANGFTSNALVSDALTDIGGGACFNDARVEVTRANSRRRA